MALLMVKPHNIEIAFTLDLVWDWPQDLDQNLSLGQLGDLICEESQHQDRRFILDQEKESAQKRNLTIFPLVSRTG